MNRVFVLSVILLFLLPSCGVIQKVSGDLKNRFPCYENNITQIDSLIIINGYYAIGLMDSITPINMIFFKDGIFLYNFDIEDDLGKGEKDMFYTYYCWGNYTINDSVIKASYVYPPDNIFTPTAHAFEVWFKVLNKNSLKRIHAQPIHEMNKQETRNFLRIESERTYLPASFVPLDSLPNSDYCWLKKEKWFWCNESDWKKYMDSLKIEKKKR